MTVLGIAISTRSKPQKNRAHFINRYEPRSLLEIRILEKQKNNTFYNRYLGEIIGVDRSRSTGKIMIRIANRYSIPLLNLDEKLFTFMPLESFKEPLNPGQFNFKEYAKRKGLVYQLTLDKGGFIKTKEDQLSISSKALMLRDRILNSLNKQNFSAEEFMIIEALLLGRTEDLSKEVTENYKKAGALRVLDISGLHIGILLMIISTILRPLERIRHGKKVKLFLLLLFLWFFAFLSGLSPSVIRAVFMFSMLTIGIVSGRSSNLDHYLFVSLFSSLLMKPLYIFNLGFQLSYIAVLSIIGIVPIVKNLWIPRHTLMRYFWNLLVVSFAAQLGILPLSLYYFHQFSGVFLLSSLISIPLLGFVLGGGYVMIVLDQINYLPELYLEIYSKLIASLNGVIGLIGKIESLIYHNIYFNLILVILCYVIIYNLVKFIKFFSFDQFLKLSISCMIAICFMLIDYKICQSKSDFIIFNQYKESLFLRKTGNEAIIYSNVDHQDVQLKKTIENYKIGHLNLKVNEEKNIKHFYKFQNKRIMVIDNDLINTDFGFEPDVLVLIKSPRINLNRLLMRIQPSVVVADGSNYRTYKSLWEKSAIDEGILFHDTSKDGAFILSDES